MKLQSIFSTAAAGAWLLAGSAATAGAIDVTIYSSVQGGQRSAELYRSAPGDARSVPGYAHVRSERETRATDGAFSLSGWPEALEPGSLVLNPADGAAIAELEWIRPERDAATLLQSYLDREIVVEQQRGQSVDIFRGRLISAGPPLVLAGDDGAVRVFDAWQGLRFPEAVERVTSAARVRGRFAEAVDGTRSFGVAYLTGGLTWWLDYHALITAEGDCRMDLSGRAVMVNRSGTDFPRANIHLVAGTPNRVRDDSARPQNLGMRAEMEKLSAPAAFGKAESVSEYYRYSLDRPADLPDGSTVQRPLFQPVSDIACSRERVMDNTRGVAYYGGVRHDRGFAAGSGADIAVYVRFANTEDNGLGRPLPAGGIRVAARSPNGGVTFIGEDDIQRIPAERDGLLQIGTAFDLMGERTQTDFSYDERQRRIVERFEIVLTNGGDESATVVVLESLARSADWQITDTSHEFEKTRSDRIRFEADVPEKGREVVTYTVTYTW